jgi:peroxiredoxin
MLNKGDTVDDFELPDETGASRTLSGLLEGGPIVLFFYPAAMTKGCTAEACHFRDIAKDFAEVGAHPVGISADKVEKQKQFADKHTLGYPLLSDTDRTVAKHARRADQDPEQARHVRDRHRPQGAQRDLVGAVDGQARRRGVGNVARPRVILVEPFSALRG